MRSFPAASQRSLTAAWQKAAPVSSCSAPGLGDAVGMAAGPIYCRDFKNLNDLKEITDAQIEKCSLVTDFEVLCPATVPTRQRRPHRPRPAARSTAQAGTGRSSWSEDAAEGETVLRCAAPDLRTFWEENGGTRTGGGRRRADESPSRSEGLASCSAIAGYRTTQSITSYTNSTGQDFVFKGPRGH